MRQNLTIVLLSIIATLLFVAVIQNFREEPVLYTQLGGGGGGGVVGPIGVATGGIQGSGDAAAFWLYSPSESRLMVYFMGNRNKLELRAVRNIEHDLKLNDFTMKPGRPPGVQDVIDILEKK